MAVGPDRPGDDSAGAWSAPARVWDVPSGQTVQSLSAVLRRDSVFAVANLLPSDPTRPLALHTAVLLAASGEVLALPPGNFHFVHPKLLTDRTGTLHLLWAEPIEAAPSGVAWTTMQTGSLWYASYAGSGWSAAEQVVSEQSLGWGAEDGQAVLAPDQGLHVVLPAQGRSGRFSLIHLHGTGGRWARSDLPVVATYASITPLGRDSLLIAYSGLDTQDPGVKGVFWIRSDDGGRSWRTPGRVTGLASDRGAAPALARSVSGTVHLFWKATSATAPATTLEHWRLGQESQEWVRLQPTPLPGLVLSARVAAPTCEQPLVVVEAVTGDRVGLYEIRGSAGSPRVHPLFPEYIASASPALIAEDAGLKMMWVAVLNDGGDPALLIADRSCGGR